jgi:hypothetical protein
MNDFQILTVAFVGEDVEFALEDCEDIVALFDVKEGSGPPSALKT